MSRPITGGTFLSPDPIAAQYPELSPYQFASNSPISGIDLDGLEYYSQADAAAKYLLGVPSTEPGTAIDPKWQYGITDIKNLEGFNTALNKCKDTKGMTCIEGVSLSAYIGNEQVKQYIMKEKVDLVRRDQWFRYFEKGGRFHKMISQNDPTSADRGDIFFDGFDDSPWKSNRGHSGILAEAPTLSKDGTKLTLKVYAAYTTVKNKNGVKSSVFESNTLIFTKETAEDGSVRWSRSKRDNDNNIDSKRYLLGFGRIDEAGIRGTEMYTVKPYKENGNTTSTIAKKFKMSLQSFKAMNRKVLNGKEAQPGQQLKGLK